mgnify:CR=1 FL=1
MNVPTVPGASIGLSDLEVLAETRHPVTIVTKSALILRDLDLLDRKSVV